jgi:outer membrane protein assembly factor BamA
LATSVFAELDERDEPGNPHAGAYVRAEATSNDSVGRGDFGFMNYLLDARGYIPLGTKRRVLALRLLGNFNDRKGGSEIPFFRLARVGDSHTLRGYDSYRFHGRNAVVSSVEYRYDLVQGIAAVAFTDFGQVFNRRSEFNTSNLHATWGGGIQFASKKSVALRILYARSGEGARLFFSFGPTF